MASTNAVVMKFLANGVSTAGLAGDKVVVCHLGAVILVDIQTQLGAGFANGKPKNATCLSAILTS